MREARVAAELTQSQMAQALNLDPTYLSQLENGHRAVDERYVEKALGIEKSNKVKAQEAAASPTRYIEQTIFERCHQYLTRVLEECHHDEDRLRWTFIELQRHFPLMEQRERTTETRAQIGAASVLPEAQQAGAESGLSHKAPSTTGKSGAPKTQSQSRPSRPRTPPKPAPK